MRDRPQYVRGDDQHHYAMLMPDKAFRRIMYAMTAEYPVIVLRAWRNPQGLIIRVMTTDGTRRHWVVFGMANLVALLESLTADLEPPHHGTTAEITTDD